MRWITSAGWPGNLIALAAGAATTLALAPFNIWPLAIVVIALFYLGLRTLNPRQALWRGWWFGFGLYGAGTSWVYVSIHQFGDASPALAGALTLAFVAALGAFFALPAWLWARWFRRDEAPLADALAFAALWVAQEAFRGWFLTGFPWLYSGYSQLTGPLSGLAPLGGVWLISFALALTATLLVNLYSLRTRLSFLAAAIVLLAAPWVAGFSLKHHQWTTAVGEPLKVMTIQGNVPQNMKWDPEQLDAQLSLYRDLTFQSKPADLIVWPETAVPILKERASGYLSVMDKFANDRNAALITGVPLRQANAQGDQRYYNAVTVVGQGSGDYLKQKLVPFGEYVPLQEVLRGLIAFFNLPMSDFARGSADQQLLQAKGYSIATYICYEVVYPEFAAGLAAQSQLLLTVSNDAWFGDSIGPLQHLQMAQMRALEAGRWMIRATNNGMTGLINPFGEITLQLPQFKRAVMYGHVQPVEGLTPYLQWRSWPLIILCGLIFGWALLAARMAKTV
ncbi:MAG: apolipoprotein N-acyltransferase [Pseudomonas marincola]|jgi:apolipoprotein N-acyltransferase|uniref:apolipoprotein N-acyltransferase n=1 Tax=Pseudomonas marincola TaxID=437900 RepID=UPI003001C51E